jgi:hypothetical protein
MSLKSVKEFCSGYLDDFFKKKPFEAYPSLSPFSKEGGLLKQKEQLVHDVPSNPTEPEKPRLLLWNLDKKDKEQKSSKVYQYLEQCKKKGPTALYGTSGVGKTRNILEYLSHNKGLYFLAKKSIRDPGSSDFQRNLLRGVKALPEGSKDSEQNYKEVTKNMRVLVYVRCLIHDKITTIMGKEPTQFEWLLLQLYPEEFFSEDIFLGAAYECIEEGRRDYPTVDLESVPSDMKSLEGEEVYSSIFIDEAQTLFKEKAEGYFVSSEDSKCARSAFSASLKAFIRSVHLFKVFPTFSGTRMSIDELMDESNTPVAKYSVGSQPPKPFMSFENLDVEAVQEYLDHFVDFGNVREAVKQHLCRWLVGRPRWTANFLELYMFRPSRSIKFSTRGRRFNEDEKRIVEALDRYIANMTEPSSTDDEDRRNSWPPDDPTSAYAAFLRVMTTSNKYPALQNLEKLVFQYAVTGKPSFVKEECKIVIENGLATVNRVEKTMDHQDGFNGILNEPIIIQAGINYSGIENLLSQNMDYQGDKGIAFEKLVLPYLQKNLKQVVADQLKSENNPFDGYRLSSKSSYGVLAKSCKGCDMDGVRETLHWIESATTTTIEGACPPFCYPDNYFGPDVLFFLWNEDYTDSRTVLSQAKYRPSFSQPEALNTMVPAWLYCNSKGGRAEKKKATQRKVIPRAAASVVPTGE